MKLEKVYAVDQIKGKVLVGYICDGVLYKDVTRSKHYFKLVKGYAIQKDVFYHLVKKGLKLVKIHEIDTGKVLVSSVPIWLEHGGIWTGQNGKQRTLSEKYMETL